MPLYSADQIINKTLLAKKPVQIKRLPADNAPVVYTVQPGQPVGTVYSWLNVGNGRSSLYWMFYDQNRRPYYAAHAEGLFDVKELATQGALTVQEQVEAEKAKSETTKQFIERIVKYIIIVGALYGLGKTVIEKKIK